MSCLVIWSTSTYPKISSQLVDGSEVRLDGAVGFALDPQIVAPRFSEFLQSHETIMTPEKRVSI